jgi:hypothetical protein
MRPLVVGMVAGEFVGQRTAVMELDDGDGSWSPGSKENGSVRERIGR